ncbi:CBS and ACT domain-containing protein [Numidum massiliense]|uniref:CBS and ACT domain-containing protein n=1 Tax=Numidum massiliense TaxID=1522315 RepID=UPI0006D56553|nr:CBS and ACT domain-containing protein [Numidum massiliense]
MLVERIMKTDVKTVHPTDAIRTAVQIIEKYNIRHLPVVEQDSLVGVVTDRDLRAALPSTLERQDDTRILAQPVSSIMTKEVITAHPRDFIEDAALLLYENRVGCLPVVRLNKVVGMITKKDILRTLIELMGVNIPSQRVEIALPDRPGLLADVAVVLKAFKINVTSVLIFPRQTEGVKHLVMRVQTIDTRKLVDRLQEKGFNVLWPSKEPDDWL